MLCLLFLFIVNWLHFLGVIRSYLKENHRTYWNQSRITGIWLARRSARFFSWPIRYKRLKTCFQILWAYLHCFVVKKVLLNLCFGKQRSCLVNWILAVHLCSWIYQILCCVLSKCLGLKFWLCWRKFYRGKCFMCWSREKLD